jgi:hypothetical protein
MTLTGPDRDEVFQWDPSEPELMWAMIKAGVQIQMPIKAKSSSVEDITSSKQKLSESKTEAE